MYHVASNAQISLCWWTGWPRLDLAVCRTGCFKKHTWLTTVVHKRILFPWHMLPMQDHIGLPEAICCPFSHGLSKRQPWWPCITPLKPGDQDNIKYAPHMNFETVLHYFVNVVLCLYSYINVISFSMRWNENDKIIITTM